MSVRYDHQPKVTNKELSCQTNRQKKKTFCEKVPSSELLNLKKNEKN